MVKKSYHVCKAFDSLNDSILDKVKSDVNKKTGSNIVYFKDQVFKNKREVCFSNKPFSKSEVDAYTTDLSIIGFRKLGLKVIGIGRLK